MKRPIVIGLTALTLIGLVGCAKPEKKIDSGSENTQSESSNKIEAPINGTDYLGKISDVVGNQVTIKLIDGDFELTDEMKSALGMVELSEADIQKLESGETIDLPDGGSMGMTSVGSASGDESTGSFDPAEDPGMSQQELIDQGDTTQEEIDAYNQQEKDKLAKIFNQIKFSGETKEFTIPAGVEIFDNITGKEMKISDIKKGSIISVLVDKDTNAVIRVEVKY